jgi:hypothetical protein
MIILNIVTNAGEKEVDKILSSIGYTKTKWGYETTPDSPLVSVFMLKRDEILLYYGLHKSKSIKDPRTSISVDDLSLEVEQSNLMTKLREDFRNIEDKLKLQNYQTHFYEERS